MEFPHIRMSEKVIIAMKGLPNTGKSEIARLIGRWANCPVLYIDDFLSAFSLEKGYSSQVMPSPQEAERLHRVAFDALWNSALRYMHYFTKCVVIKSRLCTTFELDRLLQLSREKFSISDNYKIIIIECHIKNEHRLYDRLEYIVNTIPQHKKEWYKARSRLDFEKAKDDWLHNSQPPSTWDSHLSNLINRDEKRPTRGRVIRLILDPFYDLNLDVFSICDLTRAFREAIMYLLTTKTYGSAEEGDWIREEIIRDRYEVVQFGKLRRYLVEKELRMASSREKNKYLCPTSRAGKCCVFKTYMEQEDDKHSCGVCEEPVVSEGYTCHFCLLTLHKSCAERPSIDFPHLTRNPELRQYPFYRDSMLPTKYACKSCTEGGKCFSNECNSCLFETHLKCRMMPTIVNHGSHHHPLSLRLGEANRCKACPYNTLTKGRFGCYICGLYYCLVCVLLPGKVEQNHGGHKHVLKLVYSRDGMEPEEDYWCDICYRDMDPQDWFYSCSDCPSYEAHAYCIMPWKAVAV